MLLPLAVMLSLNSCQKEETDFIEQETKESTVIEGTILTSGGVPLEGIPVKVDYEETRWPVYANTRHKAQTKTDKNGKYRLYFSIKNEEQKEDPGVYKLFNLSYDLSSLKSGNYMLPADFTAVVTSVNPPRAEPKRDEPAIVSTPLNLERSTTYTQNLYIPQKRLLKVTLKGFVPQQVNGSYDRFEVTSTFPYGMEETGYNAFPNTKYGRRTVGELFTIYDKSEQTFDVPVALNETNIITLIRKKNGNYYTEEHSMFVTATTPESLTFDY